MSARRDVARRLERCHEDSTEPGMGVCIEGAAEIDALCDLLETITRDDVKTLRENAYNVPAGWSGNPWMDDLADRLVRAIEGLG